MSFESHSIEDFILQNNINDFMDKSVLIASRELFKAKERNLQHSDKKNKAKELSLIKFLIRASTRPTPYGFFAGVALGEFSNSVTPNNLLVDDAKAIIECRVDHSWLSHLIYELENKPTVYTQLKLRFNNNCYVSGDRLKNPHYSNHGFVMPKSVVVNRNHIRNTPLITYIKQEAQTFLDYNVLKSRIQNKYPDAPEEKIVLTINMLLDNEILLTNLRVPANCVNGLEYILKILEPIEGIDKQKEDLQKVNVLVNQINNEDELDNIDADTIQSIYTLLEGLLDGANEKDLLAVNKGIALKQNKLPHELKATIENFIEGLIHLQVETPSTLEIFKQKFQEEYGSHIEVPLCDIIDQNNFNGLSYLENDQPVRDEKEQTIKQIVDEKVMYCLQTQCEEVALYKHDFSFLRTANEDKLPESFDINFFVTKKDDRYHLTVAPVGGSGSAGDMFNRFGHVLDTNLFHQYKENIKSEKNVDPDYITVEIREGATKGRLSNINNHSSKHDYYIALATNDDNSEAQELSLEDFLIGLQDNRLYIKSKSRGKVCKMVQDCMINTRALSDVSRFLLDASSDLEESLLSRMHSTFMYHFVVVPRILFEGVVVQPKSWNLPAHLFELNTLSSFAESLQRLRHKYHIDAIVYLSEYDNRLMLDLNQDYSIEIIYKHMKKNKILKLDELEQNVLTDPICFDEGGNGYVSEISCSLMLTTDKKSGITLDNQLAYALQNENRSLMLLQDGWVYAKLYNMDDRVNEVLNYISLFLNQIGNPKFFFLRYSDDIGKHLRVRFKYANEDTAQKHMPDIQKMLMSFREYKLINKVQFDIYFRENNRYGGSQLIELAEDVFFADSLFVVHLLNELNIEEEIDLEKAYLLGICTMYTAFHESIEDMFDSSDRMPLLDANKKIFRGRKQAYIKKVEQLVSHDFSDLSDQTILLIAERDEAIKQYYKKLVKTDPLTNSRENIIASIIHMFCNRLTGEGNLEQKYINITRESLSNIIEKNKRLPKKGF
jgi:thiopeptide-type bacteriocin biosynthesis protein